MPETAWDAQANAPKLDELGKTFTELATFHKSETDRLAALPQRAEQYAIKIPESIKPPDGMKIEPLPADHPMVMAARDFALKNRLPQEAFNELVAFEAKMKVDAFNAAAAKAKALIEKGQLDQAKYGEMLKLVREGEDLGRLVDGHIAEGARKSVERKKLGDNAEVRQKAVADWLGGLKTRNEISADEYEAGLAYATDAATVTLFEKLIAKAAGSVPGNTGNPPPPKPADIPIEQRWYGGGQKG